MCIFLNTHIYVCLISFSIMDNHCFSKFPISEEKSDHTLIMETHSIVLLGMFATLIKDFFFILDRSMDKLISRHKMNVVQCVGLPDKQKKQKENGEERF